MSVLSAFTEQKKIRHVYQFKRGNTFASAKSNSVSSYQPSSSLLSSILPANISSSSSSSSTAAEEQVDPSPISSTNTGILITPDVDDAIFDFPDSFDEFSEIKVMVASTRAIIPEAPKLTRKRSTPKKPNTKTTIQTNNKKKPTVSKPPANHHTKKRFISNNVTTPQPIGLAPAKNITNNNDGNHQDDEFDIFAFDPQPTSHITTFNYYNNNIQSTTRPHRSANSYNHSTLPNRNHNTRYYPISIASLLNETKKPVEKKRKRNLVAQLKTARGEKENKPISQGFDCLSDEDDLALEQQQQQQLNQQKNPLIMPLRDIIKDRSMSPELTYEETMQMQLDSLMKTEFGDDAKTQQTEKQKRPHYQPLNKLNVRVTFQKK